MTKIVLINPNIVSRIGDYSGSGIPYVPIGLASLAAYLRREGFEVHVVDGFGSAPERVVSVDKHFVQGLSANQILDRVPDDVSLIGVYAHLVVAHVALAEIVVQAKRRFPDRPLFVFENHHLVNAYSLSAVRREMFDIGVDYLLVGDIEVGSRALLDNLDRTINLPGVICRTAPEQEVVPPRVEDLDSLPFPAWDLIPLENYWSLGYAHAPLRESRYLPVVSSRGCPYQCRFCTSPGINGRGWRSRSAENVYLEIVSAVRDYGAGEIHFEDLNPTLDRKRMDDLCRLLIDGKINVKWKLAQGTKLESMSENTIRLMAQAGCSYVSFSPESGSPEVLRLMKKPFSHQRANHLVDAMKRQKIRVQACFVIGFPGEQSKDLALTRKYVTNLARRGVDEIGVFIASPLPGSELFDRHDASDNIVRELSELTLSPRLRRDYQRQSFHRLRINALFALTKLIYHPREFFMHFVWLMTGRFETKIEMTMYRLSRVAWIHGKNRLRGLISPDVNRERTHALESINK